MSEKMRQVMRDWEEARPIPPEIEEAITTPHDHETENHWPVWLIISRTEDGWYPSCICSSEESARYHYRNEMDKAPYISGAFVERVPVDHCFGSELLQMVWEENREILRAWRERNKTPQETGHPYYRGRQGD